MRHRPRRRGPLSNVVLLRSLLVATLFLSALHARGETVATSPGEEARWQAKTLFLLGARADYSGAQGRVTARRHHHRAESLPSAASRSMLRAS